MTVKQYVYDVLCCPVTRIGSRYIVEAIELVLDTQDIKFYPQLSKILNCRTGQLETAIRSARNMGLKYMPQADREHIFGDKQPNNSEYIIKAAEYYRREYADKE